MKTFFLALFMLNSVGAFANCKVKITDESVGTRIAHEFNRLGYEVVDERYEDQEVKYVVKSHIGEWASSADDLFRSRSYLRTRSYTLQENYVTSVGKVIKEEILSSEVREKKISDTEAIEKKLRGKFLKKIENKVKKCNK